MGNPQSIAGPALVVVSHYNAWPTGHLVALLDQLQSVPSGHPFSTRVVVNRAEDRDLVLPGRHSGVEVLYRENTGYNIGAWDRGWRGPPRFDGYLFLQEECVIRRPGWLAPFVRASGRGFGLVGESQVQWPTTWEELDRVPWFVEAAREGEPPARWSSFTRGRLLEMGIDPSPMADHLQALVIYATREALEATSGFRVGGSKDDAIACEVAITKAAQAAGLRYRQVGLRPFEYILHPQWEAERDATAGLPWAVRHLLWRHIKVPLLMGLRGRRAG